MPLFLPVRGSGDLSASSGSRASSGEQGRRRRAPLRPGRRRGAPIPRCGGGRGGGGRAVPESPGRGRGRV